MRPAHVISSDGLLNLYNAVCCAASDASRGMGVVISMNDLILSARDGVKFSTFKTDAFQAPSTAFWARSATAKSIMPISP